MLFRLNTVLSNSIFTDGLLVVAFLGILLSPKVESFAQSSSKKMALAASLTS